MRPLNIFIIVLGIIETILCLIDRNYTTACWSFNTALWAGMALIYQNKLKEKENK